MRLENGESYKRTENLRLAIFGEHVVYTQNNKKFVFKVEK